jgi:hypothetical protein
VDEHEAGPNYELVGIKGKTSTPLVEIKRGKMKDVVLEGVEVIA